ncbi:TonB-dependent receptor plug domain-containing protein [Sphingomonas sp.]|uniref:TonB-dependent receptor plug domain-containing protein n=1 Tax=Sphingomonas sp. TaxID=28214 RepID=UPI00345B862C
MAICSLSAPAFAQSAPAPAPAPATAADAAGGEDRAQDIVVTGSRITTSGFQAPTPTSVIGADQLAANAQPNIFATVAQLPSLQGSTGTTTNTFSTSSGAQGLSSFSLRGLGAIRTLTLLDGQRVVAANVTGVPDVSLFPQLLIKRVDVVNGGASSSYGSDAVGGVVNFITDTHFEGIKGNVQGAITNYNDNETVLVQGAYGHAFMDNRLHVVVSGEYDREKGVGPGGFGTELGGGRDWFINRTVVNRNVLNDGRPQYVVVDYAQPYNYTKYGLITSGPLQGIAFDAAGNPFQFQYGSNGTPARNAAGSVNGCLPGFCSGGDLSGNVDPGRTLQSSLKRYNGYGRIGYDFADDNEFYVSANIAQVKTQNQPISGQNRPNLTIQCSNAFLPASVSAACATAGITSFQYGTSVAILPNTQVHTDRRQYRFVAGAKGKVPVFGTDWNYDTYYERGINKTAIDVSEIMLTRRFNQAINAISLNGVIVCADPVARANGCQPINIFSGATPSASAKAYVQPEKGPYQRTRQTQDVVSLNISGSPVDLWAGPLAIAFGAEYRHEYYKVRADAYGNGILDQAGISGTPYDSSYPADPTLLDSGNNWYAGNYKNGTGSYSVKEAFFEANLPLFDGEKIGRANLNAAARVTDYSTSGTVWAWKVGGTWDTPLNGFRLRATTSRDVRAPNLSELFAAPVTTTLPNFFDPFRNVNVLVIQNALGNPALTPELARNTSVGAVLSNPSWLPGFSLSFDYYTIKIKDVISGLGANDIVNFCFQGILPQVCNSFNLNNTSGPNYVNVQSFNFASIKTEGFDIEGSYRWRRPLGLDGSLTLRGLATHIIKYVSDTGLPGTIPNDSAGVNIGGTPNWKFLTIQTYETDKWSFLVQQRWFSDGKYNNNYIECQTGCPVSTSQHPTISNNHIKGSFYLDIGGSYKILPNITAYFKVDNLLDQSPPYLPGFPSPSLYDILGRVYRAGIRFSL